jgi:glyoxylase-like metal-dependent hydrolase (beta-lactamase superfamily II)
MSWLDPEVTIHYPWECAPEFAKPLQVAEGILWFRVPLPMPLDHVNVYVLEDNDGWTVVDTCNKKNKRNVAKNFFWTPVW